MKLKVKTIILGYLSILLVSTINAQSYYVWAKTGLSLRENPSFTSKKFDLIPYGTKLDDITYIDEYKSDSVFIFANPNNAKQKFYLYGNWQAINYKGKSGFVFDAYISSMPPAKNGEYIDDYVLQNHKKLDSIETDSRQSTLITYDKGLIVKERYYEGGGQTFHYFTNRSFNDGFLLFKYFGDIPEKLEETEESTIDCIFSKNELRLSFHEGADSYISISYLDGVLILMSGGNC